jgi:type IV conjugative transfer system protein TraL
MQRIAVPNTLDAPPRFLWWDCDQVFVFGSGLVIGLAVSGMALAIATAVFLTWVWNRAKGGRGVARAFALIYWYLPADVFRRVPASARRHFLG